MPPIVKSALDSANGVGSLVITGLSVLAMVAALLGAFYVNKSDFAAYQQEETRIHNRLSTESIANDHAISGQVIEMRAEFKAQMGALTNELREQRRLNEEFQRETKLFQSDTRDYQGRVSEGMATISGQLRTNGGGPSIQEQLSTPRRRGR